MSQFQLSRNAKWRAAQRLLMDQSPEMGIALLNAETSAALYFRKGIWELGPERSGDVMARLASRAREINSSTRILVIAGVGLGYWYFQLKTWLRADIRRRLIFCAQSVDACDLFLHMPWAESLLRDPQVTVKASPSARHHARALREIAWSSLLLPLECVADEFSPEKSAPLDDLRKQVRGMQGNFDQMAGELLQFSKAFYANFYRNYLREVHVATAEDFERAFADVPVLICGAGPSLSEQASELRRLGDRALILAGGSAVNALAALGIAPHFGLGIDPNPMQEQRIRAHTLFDVPYLFRRRILAASLAAIHGPKVLVRGAAGYPLAQWLDTSKDREAGDLEVEEGHNVIHLAIDLARYFGASQIALCGMDLSYLGNRGYARDVLAGHVGQGSTPQSPCCDEPIISWVSDQGERVATHWKWIEEARWIGEFGQRHPDIALRNATPKGLGIEGVARHSLKSIFGKDLPLQRDLSGRVWAYLQRAADSPKGKCASAVEALQPVWDSLERCEAKCQQIESLLASFEERTLDQRLVLASGDWLEVEQELAFELILRFPDQMHKVILERDQEVLIRNGNTAAYIEASMLVQRCAHLRRGCQMQREEWQAARSECESLKCARQVSKGAANCGPKRAFLRSEKKLAGNARYTFEGNRLEIRDAPLGIALDVAASTKTHALKNLLDESVDHLPSGQRIERSKSSVGALAEVWLSLDGQRDGQTLLLDRDGGICAASYYRNNVLHGPSRHYLPGDRLVGEVWFVNGQRQGVERQYYQSGALYKLGGYRDDLPHGSHWTYYLSGAVKSRRRYHLGKLIGLARLYHEDGALARSVRFTNGARDGWDRQWHDNGCPAFAARYAQGTPGGIAKRWHYNGQLAEHLRYLEPGGRVETRQFSQDGKRVTEGKYLDATRYRMRAWDTRGKLVEEQEWVWRDGRLVSRPGV